MEEKPRGLDEYFSEIPRGDFILRQSDAISEQSAIDDVICPICLEFPRKPKECSICHRNFCSLCISDWESKGKYTCPNSC